MRRLLLTRPRQQAGDWLTRLLALGVEADSLPLIEILPARSPDEVKAAWAEIDAGVELAVFVSPNAVEQFFNRPHRSPWPPSTLAACVGPGSAQALRAAGVPQELIVQPAADAASLDSEHLWAALQSRAWGGCRAIFLRGEGGREWLAEQLRAAGASTQAFSVYRRAAPRLDTAEQSLLDQVLSQPMSYAWLFSSAEALGHLRALVPLSQSFAAHCAIATHSRIAESCREAGFGPVVLARPDPAAVARALGSL